MSLLTAEQVQALGIGRTLSIGSLQSLIDREEAELVRLYGANYAAAPITETRPGRAWNIFTTRAIASITSVVESAIVGDTAPTTLTTTDYYSWPGQGRLMRLPEGVTWGAVVAVTYTPVDDTSLRTSVLLDLIRLTLDYRGLQSESVAGEYSYTAGDFEARRQALYRRLRGPES